MNLLIFLAVAAWIYILTVLKRAKLPAYYFVCGSCGILVLMMIFLLPNLTEIFTELLSVGLIHVFNTTGGVEVSYEDAVILLSSAENMAAINVSYEFSGVIEILSFSAVLWFFPLFKLYEKLLWQVACVCLIYFASLIRLLAQGLTMLFAAKGGTQDIVHIFAFTISRNTVYSIDYLLQSVIFKVLFYAVVVGLYFVCFTGKQVRAQRFGGGL